MLFVCWGNSIRSQMAQAMLNYRGAGRFHAWSGGIRPADNVHPMTCQALTEAHIPAGRMRPKEWTRHLKCADAVIS
ncbi:MAG: low molecular weight phosphatase family protein, partial [Candidatus Sumerlaeota bacterium]